MVGRPTCNATLSWMLRFIKTDDRGDKLTPELGFRVRISSWILELDFGVRISSCLFELDFWARCARQR